MKIWTAVVSGLAHAQYILADIIEWRIDWMDDVFDLDKLSKI